MGHESKEYHKYAKELIQEFCNSYGGFLAMVAYEDSITKKLTYKLCTPVCNFEGDCNKKINLSTYQKMIGDYYGKEGLTEFNLELDNYNNRLHSQKKAEAKQIADYQNIEHKSPIKQISSEIKKNSPRKPQENYNSLIYVTPDLAVTIPIYDQNKDRFEKIKSEENSENPEDSSIYKFRPFLEFLHKRLVLGYGNNPFTWCKCGNAVNLDTLFEFGKGATTNSKTKRIKIYSHYLAPNVLCKQSVFKEENEENNFATTVELFKVFMKQREKPFCVVCRSTSDYCETLCEDASHVKNDNGIYEVQICTNCLQNHYKPAQCPICGKQCVKSNH